MVKCGCSTSSPCKTKRRSCVRARVAFSMIYSCSGDSDICQNQVTKRQSEKDNGSNDGKS